MENTIGIIILAATNLLGIGIIYGKLSEQMKMHSLEIKELFSKLELHVEDRDAHWAYKEREWSEKRFVNIETVLTNKVNKS